MALSWLLFSVKFHLISGILAQSFYDQNKYLYKSDEVYRFRQYLQIDTSRYENIEVSYFTISSNQTAKAVQFLNNQARELGLPVSVYEPEGLPIVVITWKGLDPTLPSIMLNSHMDVVSVQEHEWKYPPFAAHMDENGDIYARGAHDTKDIGMQYLEAIRRLKANGKRLLRTVHITYMPDEETGGYRGMQAFIKTEDFRKLNIGFALDEGGVSPTDTMIVSDEDKRPWHMEFTMFGDGGHGGIMPDYPAVVKVTKFLNRVMEFRRNNLDIAKNMLRSNILDFRNISSVSVTTLKGGDTINVIPSNITVGVDLRLSTEATVSEMDELVRSWMVEAGEGTRVSFLRRVEVSKKTMLDESNVFWMVMNATLNHMGHKTRVLSSTTDMMYLRNMGYPAVGFSPRIYTVFKSHDKDEYINAKIYLYGIHVYYEVIKNLANVPG